MQITDPIAHMLTRIRNARPRSTRGSSSAPAYTRRPGLDTRRRLVMTFSLPG